MRWRESRQSENVEDRRGVRPAGLAIGGTGGLILLVLALVFGINPNRLLQQAPAPGGGGAGGGAPVELSPEEKEKGEFVRSVLGSTEDVWSALFQEQGETYQPPKLVLFTDAVNSACGQASAAVGPFYCPLDRQVYIDLSFYDELKDKFNAPGDFAQAYVIAHEVGHHIQNLLGVSDKVRQLQQRAAGESEKNDLSVRLELQADYLAGVWAHHAQDMQNLLEAGDIEEGLRAAEAIGDDALQKQSQGYVVPDSFTHGSSEQRIRWFRRGLQSGLLDMTNTFEARDL